MSRDGIERLAQWRRSGETLVPASADARNALKRIENGEKVWLTVDRRRSVPQHRLFYAILQHVAEATEYETADRLLVWLKIRTGRFDVMRLPGKAEPVPVPHSISFAAMKQEEFRVFFDDAITIVCSEVLGGNVDQAELVAEVNSMLEPAA